MKTITGVFSGGESHFDFEGFSGDDCSKEENALRAILSRLGIESEVMDEQNKDRKTKVPEQQRIKQ